MSYLYSITPDDLQFYNHFLDNQRNFLMSNYITTKHGQTKSYLDMSFSANFSSRYYAEVSNRVNSIVETSVSKDTIPVFMTITLNGCFRDALNADFSRFTQKDIKSLPYDLKYKYNYHEAFTIRDLVYLLNKLWDSFMSRNVFRKIKSYNLFYSYIRVFEPHKKDGVPHIHALLFIPKMYLYNVLDLYKKVFYAPQNLRINMLSSEQIKKGEINGFQWSIFNPAGYVLKYIQKTFINFNKSDKLDPLSCWYVKYKVRRFLTSRSLVPSWVYRKIFFLEKNLYNLTQILYDTDSICEWDFEKKYIHFYHSKTEIDILYDNGYYRYACKGRVIYEHKVLSAVNSKTSFKIQQKPILKSKKRLKNISVRIIDKNNNRSFMILNHKNKLIKPLLSVKKMSDYKLFNHFQSLDVETCNLHHFGLVKNELIERGLLSGEIISLDDFNTDFFKDL